MIIVNPKNVKTTIMETQSTKPIVVKSIKTKKEEGAK